MPPAYLLFTAVLLAIVAVPLLAFAVVVLKGRK